MIELRLTLWGTQAERFNADANVVIAVKGCKIGDFGGVSLGALHPKIVIFGVTLPYWTSSPCNVEEFKPK